MGEAFYLYRLINQTKALAVYQLDGIDMVTPQLVIMGENYYYPLERERRVMEGRNMGGNEGMQFVSWEAVKEMYTIEGYVFVTSEEDLFPNRLHNCGNINQHFL